MPLWLFGAVMVGGFVAIAVIGTRSSQDRQRRLTAALKGMEHRSLGRVSLRVSSFGHIKWRDRDVVLLEQGVLIGRPPSPSMLLEGLAGEAPALDGVRTRGTVEVATLEGEELVLKVARGTGLTYRLRGLKLADRMAIVRALGLAPDASST